MKQWIRAVGAANRPAPRNLTYDEAVAAAHAIARGESTQAQTSAFLMGIRMKGEADEEVMAFIDVFRKYSLPYASFSDSLNCAGAYGNRRLFPVTIPVSLMMASVGFSQVLHGSDSGEGAAGSTIGGLLEALGINTELPARDWETVFTAARIGYIRTDRMCPALAGIAKLREELGIETFLNTVERLLNPVQSHQMIIGTAHKGAIGHLVEILPKAGLQKAMIVQGMEGSEDISIARTSTIRILSVDSDEMTILDPATLGFRGEPLAPVPPERQLEQLQRILEGDDSAGLRTEREHVIFNAGLRLYWHEKVASYEDGFQLARELYARKEAGKVLKKWREQTRLYAPLPPRNNSEAANA